MCLPPGPLPSLWGAAAAADDLMAAVYLVYGYGGQGFSLTAQTVLPLRPALLSSRRLWTGQ